MCGDSQVYTHRYGRLTVTPLISMGMFMHASMSLHPSGMFRSIPQYSRFPYARQSQAGQTTSQNAPWGTRFSLAFSHNSLSRPITSLSTSAFSFSTARVEFSIEACRLADSTSTTAASGSMWLIIRTVSSSTTARQKISPRGMVFGVCVWRVPDLSTGWDVLIPGGRGGEHDGRDIWFGPLGIAPFLGGTWPGCKLEGCAL